MSYCTETRWHTARRKHHACYWCGQRIKIGERYARWRSFDSRDAFTTKMHPECYADMEACAASEGGLIEFGFGEAERPDTNTTTETNEEVPEPR